MVFRYHCCFIAARVNKQGGERFKERFRFTVSSLLHVPDMRESYFIVMTNFVMKLNDHVTSWQPTWFPCDILTTHVTEIVVVDWLFWSSACWLDKELYMWISKQEYCTMPSKTRIVYLLYSQEEMVFVICDALWDYKRSALTIIVMISVDLKLLKLRIPSYRIYIHTLN